MDIKISEIYKKYVEDQLMLTKRKGIEDLLNYMNDNGFYTAPCSGMYHNSKEGGLLEHSVNVCQLGLSRLNNLIMEHNDSDSWCIVSLLHDIGKCSYRDKPNYVPNILKGGKQSESKPYETNKDRLYIPHEVVSLQIISKFIEITDEEEFAILYHNGMYVSSGRDISGKERPLQQLLHFADMWSSRFTEV